MRSRVIIVSIAVFVAVDLLLVALALRHVAAPSSPEPSTTPTPSSTSSASSSASVSAATAAVRFLAVADARTLIRATRGSCPQERPSVEVSKDGGRSFTKARVPRLAEVTGVRTSPGPSWVILGLDSRCRPSRWTSADRGRTWFQVPRASGTWALGPVGRPGKVTAPSGLSNAPCRPRAVATVELTLVRLLCASGHVLGTDDEGQSWVDLGRLRGARDIYFYTAGHGLGLAAREDCPAAVLETEDGGASWTRLGCASDSDAEAMGASGTVVAAQAGDQVSLSDDGGRTWSASR